MSSTSTGRQRCARSRRRRVGMTPKSILARLDRISVWSLPFIFVGIIGTGFLFAFYDVFDINVSFIQSCVALKHGCTPANAVTALRMPVVLNLAGYVIGALAPRPDLRPHRPAQHAAVHDAPHRPGLALQRVRPRLHAVRAGARDHRHRRRRRPRDRQHVRGRGRSAPQPGTVDLGDLHHVLAGRAPGHLARPVPDHEPGAVAARSLVRPGEPELHRRMAMDVRGRRAARGGSVFCCAWSCPSPLAGWSGQGRLEEADKVVSDMEVVAAKHGPLPPVRRRRPGRPHDSGAAPRVPCAVQRAGRTCAGCSSCSECGSWPM